MPGFARETITVWGTTDVGFRRRAYFPALKEIMIAHDLTEEEIVAGSKLNPKTISTMIHGTNFSLRSSIEKVILFLSSKGIDINIEHELVQHEADG